ncbi:hypothetical protein CDD83_3183 [Cordyceps sp. RAO-2017]|nr:hypothetical protein CDD83_3183 [Cordyceps sp. RAO-2017]
MGTLKMGTLKMGTLKKMGTFKKTQKTRASRLPRSRNNVGPQDGPASPARGPAAQNSGRGWTEYEGHDRVRARAGLRLAAVWQVRSSDLAIASRRVSGCIGSNAKPQPLGHPNAVSPSVAPPLFLLEALAGILAFGKTPARLHRPCRANPASMGHPRCSPDAAA